MNSDLEGYIQSGNFLKACQLTKSMTHEALSEAVLYLAYETESLVTYSFVNALLAEYETADRHELAYKLLLNALSYIEGSKESAAYHAKRAVDLSSHDRLQPLENLLFLLTIDEQLLTHQEALQTAAEIIELEPSHKRANEVIRKLSTFD